MGNNFRKNVIWNSIGMMAFSMTSLLYTIILMRYSTLKLAGIYSFGFALACTTTSLASFGGRTYQVTDVKNELSPFTYILSRYITVLIVTLMVLAYVSVRNYSLNKFLIVFILCIFKYIEEISDVYYGIMQKEDKLYYVGQFQLLKSIFNVIAFFLIIKFNGSLLLAVSSIAIINILFLILFERTTAKKIKEWNYVTTKNQILKYFKVNLVICLFTFLTMYLANSSKYSIDIYLSDEAQAIFGILIMPATVMLLVCNFIVNPILLPVADLYNKNQIFEINKIFRKIIILIFLIGVVGLIVCYFIGIPFLNFIYSSDFTNYKLELMLIIIGSILYSVSMICSSLLTAIRKINVQLYMNIIFSILAFIISMLFVKLYGIRGGTLSYLIVMLVRMITYLLLTLRYCKSKELNNDDG